MNNFQKNFAFILISFLLFSNCAKKTLRPVHQETQKKWFEISERYTFPDFEGNVLSHAFFDFESRFDEEKRHVDFVLTTPQDSPYGYQMDLVSGQLFRHHQYCSESDIWKRYRSRLNRPPVTMGIVPRMIDQAGQAQEVMVFGRSRYFHPFERVPTKAQRVRIVGGVIHQYCNEYPCQTRERWLSRLVLIAVNENDPQLTNVTELDELKKKVDWGHFKAFMENSYGRNVALALESPAYRVTGELKSQRSVKALAERGLKFTPPMMQSMQRSCHALYNYIWFSSERIRENIRNQTNTPLQLLSLSENDADELKRIQTFLSGAQNPLPGGAQRNFALFLDHFVSEYGKSFLTCSQYVRDSNINLEPDRHWFIAYLKAYLLLEEMGQVYLCNRSNWMENPLLITGERQYDASRERKRCLPSQLDRAFDLTLTGMVGRRSGFKEHYRYIEYDSFQGGSHQKMYSWVHDNGKRLSCDKTRPYDIPLFPQDVSWKPFSRSGVEDNFQISR